jgi:hypothetical protein
VPELHQELVKTSQNWISQQYQAEATRWGEQKEKVWQDYTDWMLQHQILPAPVDISKVFTNEFLP